MFGLPAKPKLPRADAECEVFIAGAPKFDILGLLGVPEPQFRGLVETTCNVVYVVREFRILE